jgi:hypothetical protein
MLPITTRKKDRRNPFSDPEAFPYRHGVPVGQARSTAHNAR